MTWVWILSALMVTSAATQAADEQFPIRTFEVTGNSLLSQDAIRALTQPYIGENRVYGDIQRALEALENAYRQAGYSAVQVYAPEQEVTGGVVLLQVTETPISTVTVTGNQIFGEQNIRRSLPSLKEGDTVNTLRLSREVQLANENSAKKVEAKLAVGDKENTVDATVKVTEDMVQRYYLSLDNTGNRDSGNLRMSVSYQHANLFDRDHGLSMTYITSPDMPSNAKLDVYAIGYRIPFYDRSESLDLLYAYADTTAPVTAAGTLLQGKGEILTAKWTHHLPRIGEYSSKLILGLDLKRFERSSATEIADYRLMSGYYYGRKESTGHLLDYQVGAIYNLGPETGETYTNEAGGRQTRSDFMALRLQGSYLHTLPKDWMFRLGVSAQHSLGLPLPASEQLGIAGMNAVRGFLERAVEADSGIITNFELYTPELASLVGVKGNLRTLAFYDFGEGYNDRITAAQVRKRLASYGFGIRYNMDKSLAFRLDLARIDQSYPKNVHQDANGLDTNEVGDWRGHFTLTYSF